MREQPAITAYHEAGHAIMAMACGFTVNEMSNESSDVGHGYVSWSWTDPITDDKRKKIILVFAAGMAADFLHWKIVGRDPDEASTGHNGDRQQAAEHLNNLNQDDFFDLYVSVALRLLKREDVWPWVELFARLLLGVGTVNGRQVLDRAAQQCPKITNEDIENLDALVAKVQSDPSVLTLS